MFHVIARRTIPGTLVSAAYFYLVRINERHPVNSWTLTVFPSLFLPFFSTRRIHMQTTLKPIYRLLMRIDINNAKISFLLSYRDYDC